MCYDQNLSKHQKKNLGANFQDDNSLFIGLVPGLQESIQDSFFYEKGQILNICQ